MTTLQLIKECIYNGYIYIPAGNADPEITDLTDKEIQVIYGHVQECADSIMDNNDWHGYENANRALRQIMDAYLYAMNSGLQSFMDNASQKDKAIIKYACPNFYQAAENVKEIETHGFEPLAILGKENDNNSWDARDKAIDAMRTAWGENLEAENGDLGPEVAEAMTGTFDALLYEVASDPDYVCQLRFTIEDTPDGYKLIVDGGMPLQAEYTPIFSAVIPDGIDDIDKVTDLILAACQENNCTWLI